MDFETLQERHTKIHFFGLGFIQVKLGLSERVHLYHPELAAFVSPEEIHDHRYEFTSHVLKGCLRQSLYAVSATTSNSNHLMRTVSCDPNQLAPAEKLVVSVDEIMSLEAVRGSAYRLPADTFHKVLPAEEPTVTHLFRGPKIKEFARVVSVSSNEVCPFSKDLEEAELWDWVRRILL